MKQTWFSRHKKFFLIFSGAAIVLSLLGSALYMSKKLLQENVQRTESIVKLNLERYNQIEKMTSAIRDRILYLYDMYTTDDPFERDELSVKLSDKAAEFIRARETLISIGITREQRQQLEAQKQLLKQVGRVINQTAEKLLNDENNISFTEIHHARRNNAIVLNALKQMLLQQSQISDQQFKQTRQKNAQTNFRVNILFLIAILFSLITIAYIFYLINQQDKLLQQALDDLARHNKNLQQTVENKTRELLKAREENIRISAEIEVSQQIQEIMLPTQMELQQVPHLDVAIFMQPAEEVGGDYIDVLEYQKDRVLITIGDVTGHGLESGLIMMMVQSLVRHQSNIDFSDMSKALNNINISLYQNIQRMGNGKNLSLLLMDYHYNEQARCGEYRLIGQHESVLILREKTRNLDEIETDELGFPVGMVDDISEFCQEYAFHLQANDVLILYTDGITEAANQQDELYGLERFKQSCLTHYQQAHDAETIKQGIISDIQDFVDGQKLYDDISLIIIKQK